MRISIRKMPQGKRVVRLILWFSLFFDAFVAEFRLPSAILYINDVLMLFLIALELKSPQIKIACIKVKMKGVYVLFLLLFLYSLLTSLMNLVNPALVLWGARNMFRYMLYLGFCVRYLDKEDIDQAFELMYIVNIISFVLVLYQHYVLGLIQDSVGGIFGHGNGAALNAFQAMILAFYFCKYLKKECGFHKVLVIIATSFYAAAVAEEKAFFLYSILIVAIAILLNKPSIKTGIITGLGAVAGIFAVEYMYEINPWMKEVNSIESLINYANNAYSISRINPFVQINNLFFHNSLTRILSGFGFGACEYSDGIAAFNSTFAKQFSHMGYMGFIHQMRYLETGSIGLLLLMGCFIAIFVYSLKQRRRAGKTEEFYFDFTAVYSIVLLSSIWMAASIRNKEAFIFYFGLSTAPVLVKYRNKKNSIQ